MEIINSYFEAPMFLLLIPALFFLLIIGKKQKKIPASSVMLFKPGEKTGFKGRLSGIVYFLPDLLMIGGVFILIVAAAEPRSFEQKTIQRIERGRVAIIIDDVSGSMSGEPLEILKHANRAFLDVFCKTETGKDGLSQNRVGIVVFSNEADIRMTPTKDCAVIRRRINALNSETSTAIEKGLWKGLALLIDWVDNGQLIPAEEFQRVKASLYERQIRIPKNSAEFCKRYKGLSLLLFTDGEFYGAESRKAVLRANENKSGLSDLNPFNVIDLAKSLCVRTYFWSTGNLPQAFKEAFSNPPGTGFAAQVAGISKSNLAKSYAEVAERESGEIITEHTVIWSPLKRYFTAAGIVCFLIGLLILWSKNYSHHAGKDSA